MADDAPNADSLVPQVPDISTVLGAQATYAPAITSSKTDDAGNTLAPLGVGAKDGEVLGRLVDKEQQRVGAMDAQRGEQWGQMSRDQRRVQEAFNATAIQPGEFPKWDAEEQSRKFKTDPVQAFGSLGSVFGMLASAFTHAPMETALNASSAAMDALYAGDQRGFERAHTAWKENTELAFKRHQLQHQAYSDAIQLMNTNMVAGEAKARMLAAKYGDEKGLILLEAGMAPEWMKLVNDRNETALKTREVTDKMTEKTLQDRVFKNVQQEAEKAGQWEADPEKREIAKAGTLLAGWERVYGAKLTSPQANLMADYFRRYPTATPEEAGAFALKNGITHTAYGRTAGGSASEAEFAKKWWEEHPQGTAEEFGAAIGAFKQAQKVQSPDSMFVQQYYAEHPNATVEEFQEAYGKWKREQKGGATVNPQTAQNVADKEAVRAAVKAEHPDWDDAKVVTETNRRLAQSKTAVSGNKQVELRQRMDKSTHAIESADRIIKTVQTHKGAAGIAGKVMRLEERLSNIAGSNNAERVQMMREVELLRGWAKELMFSKNERLKAEGQRINDIVGGTSAGDTGPNTVKALRRVKEILEQIRGEDERTLKEGPQVDTPGPKPAPPAGGNWWQGLPDKRSAAPGNRYAARTTEGQNTGHYRDERGRTIRTITNPDGTWEPLLPDRDDPDRYEEDAPRTRIG